MDDLPAKPSSGELAERRKDAETVYSVLGSVETKGGTGQSNRRRRTERRLGQEPESDDDDERPLLRVNCSGVMGSVELKLR